MKDDEGGEEILWGKHGQDYYWPKNVLLLAKISFLPWRTHATPVVRQ